MRRSTSHHGAASNKRPYPCVIADRFPGKCKRSFNNIEKLNEHIKRCHSPFLWCNDCLKKFNSSMSLEALEREKAYHKAICPKEPSEKNKALREKAYVIDEARYELCKKLGWKQTAASHELNRETGGKECVSQRSWRQIRDTIFPSDTVTVDESHELVARVENETRNEMFLTQFRDSHVPTQIEISTISQPPPTADNTSLLSTVLSEVTTPLTGPTTIAFSDPGPDGLFPREMENFDYGLPPLPNFQDHESANSLTGAGKWDTGNLDLELDPDMFDEQWFIQYTQNDLAEGE
ncbi:hypothetical protein H9Q69_010037 [Fusarium xylarioides]|uniref:Uncharacterized protein n=1 Tax=Fusarium xylarioides TaxID=221167 RepID=A0A9P7ICV1_9HYPO|nr:hypothetical protein H9Q70_003181 [Fusarium xylarioides]KAG5774238.1 hypothetical protein H9Q72_000306 [Fusarium xylarioides]KAG5783975.1 hypothetical protein H9Q73_002409 [Fusarium xylarioides]KAG5790905.1 hypothetical protein H9Q69_010037 [Fusarium xylarioides]KAG5816526.1 hypothetical protein H9Q71_002291 [Fusarium xylarioides]